MANMKNIDLTSKSKPCLQIVLLSFKTGASYDSINFCDLIAPQRFEI